MRIIECFVLLFIAVFLTSCKSREVHKTMHKEKVEVEIKEQVKVDSTEQEISTKISDLKIFEENFNINIKPKVEGEPVRFNLKIGDKEYKGEANGEVDISNSKKNSIIRDTIYTEKIKEVIKEVYLDKKEEKEVTDREKQQKVEYLEAQYYAVFILSVIALYKLSTYLIDKYNAKWKQSQ